MHESIKKYGNKILNINKVGNHTLRHSFATILYGKGVPIEKISIILGHEDIATTMIYTKIDLKSQEEAISVMNKKKGFFGRIFSKINQKKQIDIAFREIKTIHYRDQEIEELNRHLEAKRSIIIYGLSGSGKTMLTDEISNKVVVHNIKPIVKKLQDIVLEANDMLDDKEYCEIFRKEVKSKAALIKECINLKKVIVFDDITKYSPTDRQLVKALSEVTTVVALSRNKSDKNYFVLNKNNPGTFIDLRYLNEKETKLIMSDMINLGNHKEKQIRISEIFRQVGFDLKQAKIMIKNMENGKDIEDIYVENSSTDKQYIGDFLLFGVLFFFIYKIKAITAGNAAWSYALLVVFRIFFMKKIMNPSSKVSRVKSVVVLLAVSWCSVQVITNYKVQEKIYAIKKININKTHTINKRIVA